MTGQLAPAGRASARSHPTVAAAIEQVQPSPEAPRGTRPAGITSRTVTTPAVAHALTLRTATEYEAPFCPCSKFPACDFVIVKSAWPLTRYASVAVLLPVSISLSATTVAVLIDDSGNGWTSTWSVMLGYLPSGGKESDRVHVTVCRFVRQSQPVPEAPVGTSPAGTVSVTVTGPLAWPSPTLRTS